MGIRPLNERLQRAVFLDRDGTLIRTSVLDGVPRPARTVEEIEILPGVPEALERLRARGYCLIVVTNQPDVARGTLARGDVEAMHALLARTLPLDEIVCCYHDDVDECVCRKPRPGMLMDAAQRLGISLPDSLVVGDRAGCTTILLRESYSGDRARPDYETTALPAAVDIILRCSEEPSRS
jgi:D-glycero-D-manno-heptose 1,7-bisphosphate phosphatase